MQTQTHHTTLYFLSWSKNAASWRTGTLLPERVYVGVFGVFSDSSFACLRTIKSLIQNMVTGVTKVRFVGEEEFGLDGVERGKGADDALDYRASNTKCAPSMPISRSTASSKSRALLSKSGISWARRCVGCSTRI